MPNRVGEAEDIALPADRVTGDEEGELAEVAGDERAGLTAAETGDRTDGEGGEVRQRGGEVSEQVGAVGQRAAVDGREGDGVRAAVGGERTDVQDRSGTGLVDVTETEGGEIARGRAQDEAGDGQVARDAVAGFDDAAVGDVDRAEESARAAQHGRIGDIDRDIGTRGPAEREGAAVDIDRDRAGQGAGRAHGEHAGPCLDELAGGGTRDRAAEGGVGPDGERAGGAELDRAARGSGAFQRPDRLHGTVKVEGRAHDVREAHGGIRGEHPGRTGLERTRFDRSLDGVGLGRGDGPHPCPALSEGSGVDEVGGEHAVAGAREHEGAVRAVGALRVERTGRAVQGQDARVGAQRERAAVGRTQAGGPGVGPADVLEQGGRRRDAGIGDAAGQLEGRAGGDGERRGGAERRGVSQAQRAGRNDRGAGEHVGRTERGETEAFLGEAGRAEGERAAEDEVARAAERQGMTDPGNRAAERERAGVADEAGRSRERDGAGEGVGSGEIPQDARSGDAGTGQEQRFAAGDAARDPQGRAGEDDGGAAGRPEGGTMADRQGALVDLGHAGVIRSARESEHAHAVLIKGQGTERAVVDRTREEGVRPAERGEHRAAGEETGVRDDAARAREDADRRVAGAEDVEDAAVDRERAIETGITAQGAEAAQAERARGDGRAAGVQVLTGKQLDARAGLHEGEITGELAAVGPVAREDAAVVRGHVDRERRQGGGAVRDDPAGADRGADERADRLVETVEVDGRRRSRANVHDRPHAEGVRRTEGDERSLIGEVIVIRGDPGNQRIIRETHVTGAGRDHLTGRGGHGTRDIQGRAIRGEKATGDGGMLDEDRSRERPGASRSRQENRAFTTATAGEPDVEGVRDGDVLIQLELSGAVEVDDVGAGAERASGFDAEGAVRTPADVHFTDEVVGGVAQDDHARARLRQADVTRDLRLDGEEARGGGIPLMQDQVLAVT